MLATDWLQQSVSGLQAATQRLLLGSPVEELSTPGRSCSNETALDREHSLGQPRGALEATCEWVASEIAERSTRSLSQALSRGLEALRLENSGKKEVTGPLGHATCPSPPRNPMSATAGAASPLVSSPSQPAKPSAGEKSACSLEEVGGFHAPGRQHLDGQASEPPSPSLIQRESATHDARGEEVACEATRAYSLAEAAVERCGDAPMGAVATAMEQPNDARARYEGTPSVKLVYRAWNDGRAPWATITHRIPCRGWERCSQERLEGALAAKMLEMMSSVDQLVSNVVYKLESKFQVNGNPVDLIKILIQTHVERCTTLATKRMGANMNTLAPEGRRLYLALLDASPEFDALQELDCYFNHKWWYHPTFALIWPQLLPDEDDNSYWMRVTPTLERWPCPTGCIHATLVDVPVAVGKETVKLLCRGGRRVGDIDVIPRSALPAPKDLAQEVGGALYEAPNSKARGLPLLPEDVEHGRPKIEAPDPATTYNGGCGDEMRELPIPASTTTTWLEAITPLASPTNSPPPTPPADDDDFNEYEVDYDETLVGGAGGGGRESSQSGEVTATPSLAPIPKEQAEGEDHDSPEPRIDTSTHPPGEPSLKAENPSVDDGPSAKSAGAATPSGEVAMPTSPASVSRDRTGRGGEVPSELGIDTPSPIRGKAKLETENPSVDDGLSAESEASNAGAVSPSGGAEIPTAPAPIPKEQAEGEGDDPLELGINAPSPQPGESKPKVENPSADVGPSAESETFQAAADTPLARDEAPPAAEPRATVRDDRLLMKVGRLLEGDNLPRGPLPPNLCHPCESSDASSLSHDAEADTQLASDEVMPAAEPRATVRDSLLMRAGRMLERDNLPQGSCPPDSSHSSESGARPRISRTMRERTLRSHATRQRQLRSLQLRCMRISC